MEEVRTKLGAVGARAMLEVRTEVGAIAARARVMQHGKDMQEDTIALHLRFWFMLTARLDVNMYEAGDHLQGKVAAAHEGEVRHDR
ncbi:hypothetical protein L7F22_039750 [Adiantum nelumboides]|nr:hypothetical protein [Adiantum nelumboides]